MSYPRRQPLPELKTPWFRELVKQPLAGSEKQVVWATDIRHRKCAELEAIRPATILHLLKLKGLALDELVDVGFDTPERASGFLARVKLHAASECYARWWIDRRDEEVLTWLHPSAHHLKEAYLKHPPNWKANE